MWTTARAILLILFICYGTKRVWCNDEDDESKRPECSKLGGKCVDDKNNCKGIVLHSYNYKNKVNCMCCINLKDDEKIQGLDEKETTGISKPRNNIRGKKCANAMRNKCKNKGGRCKIRCKANNEEEVPNGCKKSCKCCTGTGTRTCKATPSCTKRGGQCIVGVGCSKGFDKLKAKCKGKTCVCCKPKPCGADDSCTANGGSCVLSEEDCKGRILGDCSNGGCKCCIPQGKCALKDEFECASNKDPVATVKKAKCVDAAWQCDKDDDCSDSSDEQDCNFADNLSCYWCKTWERNTGASVDSNCKNSIYDGNTENMAKEDPFIGCATKVYVNGDVWRGFQSWQRVNNMNNTKCEFGRDYDIDDKSAFKRCWCNGDNCNSDLCEACDLV